MTTLRASNVQLHAELQELRTAQPLRRGDHILPSALASSMGRKQLVWQNCDSGKWSSLSCTTTQSESTSVWSSLCAMDGSSADDGAGLDWQEALPVVKRLRLQIRRLQQKALDSAPLALASSSVPMVPYELPVPRHELPSSPAEVPKPTSPPAALLPLVTPLAPAPSPTPPAALVRVLGTEERPTLLWGRGGLCGEEQPHGGARWQHSHPLPPPRQATGRLPTRAALCAVRRTKLFVNLTAGLELLRHIPAVHMAGVGFCHMCAAPCRALPRRSTAAPPRRSEPPLLLSRGAVCAAAQRTSSAALTSTWCASPTLDLLCPPLRALALASRCIAWDKETRAPVWDE